MVLAPLGAIRAGFSLRVAEGAAGCSVRNIDLRLSTGNRRQSRSVAVLRGCEGPRPGATIASDPVAPSHFCARRASPNAIRLLSLIRPPGVPPIHDCYGKFHFGGVERGLFGIASTPGLIGCADRVDC